MRRLKISPDSIDSDAIAEAVEVLKGGGVMIYPTETVYGLGACISSEKAVKRVYAIKKRDESKPLSVALSAVSEISKYAKLKSAGIYGGLPGLEFIQKNLPGPFTVVLEKKNTVPDYVCKGTVGIRIPEYACIRRVIELAGPITSTSANVSEKAPPVSAEEVDVEADLLLDGGKCRYGKPSKVIDLISGKELR
jgi:L-threonylcarbamoyladenylate synthase